MAAEQPPPVSIVIPTFNNIELTRRCLSALQGGTPAPRHEVIVVDNGSTDGTSQFLRAEESAGRLRAILNTENAGFAAACNQGARAARGKYVLFLNNDTEVQTNWLGPLFSLAEADPAIAAASGKLIFPNGTIQHAGVALADCKDHDPLLAFHLFAREKSDFPLANQRRIYQVVTAACMLVRKSSFDQVGGFDEQYWNGYEDVDLCLRFQERGWITVYEPASVVIHHESQSGPERFRRVADNVERFHRLWLEKASPDVIIEQNGKSSVSASSRMRLYTPPTGKLVSIIILAHNQLKDTQQCLASIERHTPPAHELILVDNGSTDGTGNFFRTYAAKHSQVRVILNRANLGFSAGNNQGLALARGERHPAVEQRYRRHARMAGTHARQFRAISRLRPGWARLQFRFGSATGAFRALLQFGSIAQVRHPMARCPCRPICRGRPPGWFLSFVSPVRFGKNRRPRSAIWQRQF